MTSMGNGNRRDGRFHGAERGKSRGTSSAPLMSSTKPFGAKPAAMIWSPSWSACAVRIAAAALMRSTPHRRSEEHTSELQSLMRISYAVFCLKKKKKQRHKTTTRNINQQTHKHYTKKKHL